jgi:hypothetical protein
MSSLREASRLSLLQPPVCASVSPESSSSTNVPGVLMKNLFALTKYIQTASSTLETSLVVDSDNSHHGSSYYVEAVARDSRTSYPHESFRECF